jgi:anti-sigma factor RsiW
MSACRRAAPLLESFVDGELPADKVLEAEQHMLECNCCRERVRLTHALQVSTRRAVRADAQPSEEFQARLLRALAAERAQEGQAAAARSEQERRARSKPLPWRTIVPVAAAAGFTLAFAASKESSDLLPGDGMERRPLTGAGMTSLAEAMPVTASVDRLLEELVEHHATSAAPDVTEPAEVRYLEPEVGVPLQLPSLNQYGARWEGASVVPIRHAPPVLVASQAPRNLRAASLRYRLGAHRVTLYVYDSSRFPLRATLEPSVVRNMPVYVGSRRGYSIAAVERRGLGWAVATDLGDRESAELVAASVH